MLRRAIRRDKGSMVLALLNVLSNVWGTRKLWNIAYLKGLGPHGVCDAARHCVSHRQPINNSQLLLKLRVYQGFKANIRENLNF